MNRSRTYSLLVAAGVLIVAAWITPRVLAGDQAKAAPSNWAMNATIIEACSCPMFCQCYFNAEPAAHAQPAEHHEHGGSTSSHFCKFNNAYKVNKGNYGSTKLDGAKFWATGDLGANFGDGETEWLVVTFDPSVTKEQREGIGAILGHVYPVKWKSFEVAPDATVEWMANKNRAEARLNGGKNAEVLLTRFPGMSEEPVVIKNLRYFGAPRNDGFIMMPNEVEAYRIGDKAFEYRNSNGFMITFDIKSSDVKPAM
jgi:hypothetical protein